MPPAAETTPSTPEASAAIEIKEGASFDEMLSNLPEDRLASLTRQEINAASAAAEKGDLQAVAEIFGFKKPEAAKPKETPKPEDETELETSKEERVGERVFMRGLSAKDRSLVISIVDSVKAGKYASFAEAQAALAPNLGAKAEQALATEPEAPEVPAEIAALEKRIEQIRADKKAATKSYDHERADELTDELVEARFKLLQAKQEHAQSEIANRSFDQTQKANITLVETQYAKQLENPAFKRALRAAQIVAEEDGDPVMQSPDWPIELAKRIEDEFKSFAPAKFPTAPTPVKNVRGLTETPGNQGTSMITKEQALASIDNMSDEEAAAVLAQMKRIELARR